jgi:sec-independent protein translocase protein TatA
MFTLLIVALVILVLFGAKRLPDAARSLGRSMRIFKAETKGLMDDEQTVHTPPPAQPAQTVQREIPPTAPQAGAPSPAAPGQPTTEPYSDAR